MEEKRLTKTAHKLRRDMTDAERKLWSYIRNRQLENTKFVKQFQIGPHIADFAARSLKLVVELDGGQHDQSKDAGRTKLIEAHGYRIVRFWNNDMMENIDGVTEAFVEDIRIARGH